MVQKKEIRPRGRPRAYDPETALTRATDTFWRAGFSATSLDELGAAMGMNRPSLYGAFGDKRALYLATLDRYIEAGRQAMDAALAGDLPLRKELKRLYERALAMYLPAGDTARGCFLIGTAAAESVNDPEVRFRLGEGLRLFDRAFEARFRLAQKRGELDATVDAVALSRIASAILHTLAVRSRAGDSPATLRATVDAGVSLLCGPAGTRRHG
jgi:AcrR family transcriptional regulator